MIVASPPGRSFFLQAVFTQCQLRDVLQFFSRSLVACTYSHCSASVTSGSIQFYKFSKLGITGWWSWGIATERKGVTTRSAATHWRSSKWHPARCFAPEREFSLRKTLRECLALYKHEEKLLSDCSGCVTVTGASYFTLGVPLAGVVLMEYWRAGICQATMMLERRRSLCSVVFKIQTKSCFIFFLSCAA